MDEYIKREDALDAVLFALVGTGHQRKAIYAIRDVPTADVVPKSEVERLQKALDAYEETSGLKQAKAEVAREIFEELERTVMHPNWASQNYKNWYFAELKKKYTGVDK